MDIDIECKLSGKCSASVIRSVKGKIMPKDSVERCKEEVCGAYSERLIKKLEKNQ